MSVNDEATMELEMLKAIAGDDAIDGEPRIRNDCPNSLKNIPCIRIAIAREVGVPPELLLWVGFHSELYPGNGGEECVPKIVVELEPNAPIRHRPEVFETAAREAALAEGGQMCINQVYQRCVDGLVEAEENIAKAAAGAASAAADASAALNIDPTIRLGTMMTPEIFRQWKEKFEAEKAAKAAREAGGTKKQQQQAEAAAAAAAANTSSGGASKVRLTGKQMWDQTLASADWKLFEKGADGDGDGDDGDLEDVDYVFGDESDEDGGNGGEDKYDFGEGEEGEGDDDGNDANDDDA